MSAIEWTDVTWNPATGCDRVSAGCDHCYALTMAKRLKAMGNPKYQTDGNPTTSGPGFGVAFHEDALALPSTWRTPKRVFVNSMADLFHKDIGDHQIARVFAVMARHPQHTFQILTKRHNRLRSLVSGDLYDLMASDLDDGLDPVRGLRWPLPNVWLGVSVEDQRWSDIRIPALVNTPAAVRFLSCEPLLGPIDLRLLDYYKPTHQNCSGLPSPAHEPSCGVEPGKHWGIDWVIVGGESGPGARLMQLDWARSLRDQCVTARVPFLFKQWGEWEPTRMSSGGLVTDPRERHGEPVEDETGQGIPWRRLYRRVGKKAAGRELDGRTWDEYPQAVAS